MNIETKLRTPGNVQQDLSKRRKHFLQLSETGHCLPHSTTTKLKPEKKYECLTERLN